jgi:OOP family OmpA-OmpF porin
MNKKAIILSLSASLALSGLQAQDKFEFALMFGNVKSDSKLNIDNEKNIGLRAQCKKNMKEFSFGGLTKELAISRNISKVDYDSPVTGNTNMTRLGVNAILNFNTDSKLVPYALVGLGKEFVSSEKSENDDDGFYNYGVGIKYPIKNYALRLEAEQIEHFDGDGDRFGIFAGLAYGFGGTKGSSNGSSNAEDGDNDGIIGIQDKCPYSKDGAKVDEYGCEVSSSLSDNSDKNSAKNSAKSDECPFVWSDKVAKPVIIKNKVVLDAKFKLNSDKFKYPAVANDEISRFADYVKGENLYSVVEGHTSSEGSAQSNLTLSQKRADRVRSELIKLGVDASKVVALGYGESNPMTSDSVNSTNRRIETETFKTLEDLNSYVSGKKAEISKNALNEKN